MRFVIGVALALAAAVPASACNEELFVVRGWSAEASEAGRLVRTEMNVDVRYEGDRAFRMIHAGVMFSDVLGNALVTTYLDKDGAVEPGAEISLRRVFEGRDSRITAINRDDVVARTCVWSIVYDDGEVVEF